MIDRFLIAILTAIAAVLMVVGPVVAVHAETTCRASWYFEGARTANGEPFRPDGLTAAHLRYPFGARLRVTYAGRSVVVRVNDRGPARWTGRCIDLSRGAATRLGLIGPGVASVTIVRLS